MRQVLGAVDAHDLLEVQRPRLADDRAHGREALGEDAQALVVGGRDAAPPRHAERGDLGVLEALLREQLEELELLRVGRREAGLDQVDAELVELARDAHLLADRQRQAGSLHAVAQGRVVELDVTPSKSPPRGIRPRGLKQMVGVRPPEIGNRIQPLAVALGAPMQRVLEGALHRARQLAGLAAADRVIVDLAHRHQLGRGAGHEQLVGQVELGARDVSLDDLEAEVMGDLDRRLAVDAVEDAGGLRRGDDRPSRTTKMFSPEPSQTKP